MAEKAKQAEAKPKIYHLTKEELAMIKPFYEDAKSAQRIFAALEAVVKNFIRTTVFARLNLAPDTKVLYDLERGVIEVKEQIIRPAPAEVVKFAQKLGKKPIQRKK